MALDHGLRSRLHAIEQPGEVSSGRGGRQSFGAGPSPAANLIFHIKIISQFYVLFRWIDTPPFVVTARTSAPPEPRSIESRRLISPCTVTGKSTLMCPFTVPVSR